MLRTLLLKAARNERIKDAAMAVPVTRSVVNRFVAGEQSEHALTASAKLVEQGLLVSIDHLGEDTTDRARAEQVALAYLELLQRVQAAGLGEAVEVSVKLSALGQALPDGESVALDHARLICAAARNAGTTVTVDMEDHTTTDSTLGLVTELRQDFPQTGAVIQAYLRRSEDDCRALAASGSRVRLCKGAYAEPETVAYAGAAEVDRAYVRCLRILMEGEGYPMVATHDPRLVSIALELAERNGRAPDSWELQMLYGIRPDEQQRLVRAGHRMRVYLPYGTDWYGYLVRRLAEKPANLSFFLKGLTSRS